MADPVGKMEIAERLGLTKSAVHAWLYLHPDAPQLAFPPAEYPSINGSRAWEWRTVLRWAGLTGKLVYGPAIDAYIDMFDEDPLPARRGGKMSAEQLEVAKQMDHELACPVCETLFQPKWRRNAAGKRVRTRTCGLPACSNRYRAMANA